MTIEGFEFRQDVTDPDILARVTADELAVMKGFTADRPIIIGGDEDDEDDECTDPRTVWLKVGVQSFPLDGYVDNLNEAEWKRWMLAKALISFRNPTSSSEMKG